MEILKTHYQKRLQRFFIFCGAFVSAGLLFVACEKDATIKLPNAPSKLVVISYISPQDSVVKVFVNLSLPLFDHKYNNEYEPLQGANVTISSDLGTYQLPYNPAFKSYLGDTSVVKIREGVVYHLSVSTADGKNATASTLIPSRNQTLTVNIVEEQRDYNTHAMNAEWPDPANSEDYYRILIEVSNYYIFEGYNNNGSFSDTIRTKGLSGELVKDTESPGGIIRKSIGFNKDKNTLDSNFVYLLHVSKEYYDYTEKLPLASAYGNPFSEPVQMYTNISGGFGVFAGFNQYRRKITL